MLCEVDLLNCSPCGSGCLFKYLCLDSLPIDPYSSWPWMSFRVLLCLSLLPLLKKPSEGWLEPAQDQNCVQDVYLSTCFLAFIQSAMWPRAIVQGLSQSPWVLRVEKETKWAGRLGGDLRTLQGSRNGQVEFEHRLVWAHPSNDLGSKKKSIFVVCVICRESQVKCSCNKVLHYCKEASTVFLVV